MNGTDLLTAAHTAVLQFNYAFVLYVNFVICWEAITEQGEELLSMLVAMIFAV